MHQSTFVKGWLKIYLYTRVLQRIFLTFIEDATSKVPLLMDNLNEDQKQNQTIDKHLIHKILGPGIHLKIF